MARDQRMPQLVHQQADRDADGPDEAGRQVATRKHVEKEEVERVGRDPNARDGEQMKPSHIPRIAQAALPCPGALVCAALPAPARAWEAGGHAGVGLDSGSVHLGGDLVFPIVRLSPAVEFSLWPSAAFVITDGPEGVLLGLDFPFEFIIADSIVKPFVGPGFGVWIADEHAQVKLNVIGGLFIDTGTVRPFAELALRFIHGTYVDLLAGVLVEL